MRTERLENLKVKLLEQPKNEQLITKIHELDLQLRKDKFRHLYFSQKGALLLLGALAVFFVGIKSAKTFKEKLPYPPPVSDQQFHENKKYHHKHYKGGKDRPVKEG